jgi:hypothetical protein
VSNRRSHADLLDQRDALLRSIEDLERERVAGDLEQEAYDHLHTTYVARTAEVLRALESASTAASFGSASRSTGWRSFRRFLGRRRVRVLLGVGATTCVLIVVGLVAARLAGVRLPGEGVTGGVVIPQKAQITQDLAQASALGSAGQINQAIALYDAVLRGVPDQPEARTYRGWLERLAGHAAGSVTLVERGDADLSRAARTAPNYADARGLYGIALLEDGGLTNLPRSLVEFRAFCRANNPGPVLAAQGRTMAQAFVAAHQVVPALLRPYTNTATKASGTGA